MIDGMVSQPIWIGIVIAVFFVGVGVSYAYFANTYDPISMKFQNQELFDQMMSNNPKMSQHWMDSGMMSQQMQKQNEDKQVQTTPSSYVEMVDGVQIVTINAKDFKFIPSEISINPGKTKFVLVNDGVAEHELVVYEASKKDIVDKAELAEDEETIERNILFEIEEVHSGESEETDVLNLQEGSYVMGCHVPGHYESGMKGTIEIKS